MALRRSSRTGPPMLMSVLLLLGLAVQRPVVGELLFGHVALAVLIALWWIRKLLFGQSLSSHLDRDAVRLVVIIGAAAIVSTFVFPPTDLWLGEFVKVVLLFLGSAAIGGIFGSRLAKMLPLLSLVLAGALLQAWASGRIVETLDGRLQLENWGSPNTLALLAALTTLALLFAPAPSAGRTAYQIARVVLVVFLAFILLSSTSRGGILGAAAGLAAVVLRPRAVSHRSRNGRAGVFLTIFALVGVAVVLATWSGLASTLLDRLDLSAEDASTGRTTIWMILLMQVAQSPPAMLFGFGPGSVQLEIFGKFYPSAHSMVVTMLYYFGIAGLAAFLIMMTRRWRNALHTHDEFSAVRTALLACLSFSFVVDAVAISTQAVLPVAVMLAVTAVPRLPAVLAKAEAQVDAAQLHERRRR